jgi:Domain of unknown function (DUF4304)
MAKTNDKLRQFDTQLKLVVAPILEAEGFVRSGRIRLWTRPSEVVEDAQQLIWFQVGESASLLGGKFTVELGIYYPQFDRFANGRKLLGPVIGACHFDVRARLGMLIAPPEDRWWRYSADEAPMAKQLDEIDQWVNELGLPWFQAIDTVANAELYNTGKVPEPDRLRREEFERQRAKRKNG